MTADSISTAPTGFRTTRGGREFSPWVSEIGLPIYAPADFNLQECYAAAAADSERVDGRDDDDDLPVATPPPHPPASGAATAQSSVDALSALDASTYPGSSRESPISNPDERFPAVSSEPTSAPSSTPGAAPPSATAPSAAPTEDSKSKSKKSSHERRRAKRQAEAEADGRGGSKPVKKVALNRWKTAVPLHTTQLSLDDGQSIADTLARDNSHINTTNGSPILTNVSLSMDEVRVASSAFVGERLEQTKEDVRPMSREDWEAMGHDYIAWDGRTCRPILTRSGEVLAALGGCPMDENWPQVNEELIQIFDILGNNYHFNKGQREHRRGKFNAVACGISYGGGQQRVSNLAQTPHNQAVLDLVMGTRAIHRIANFSSSVMHLLNPRMYEMYDSTLSELCARDPALRRNFPGNPFAAATLNVGPETVAYGHTDHLNMPNGWCAITAIGRFNSALGGHLVLWDLKLVIEFPAGSTILIPSALLKHSNTQLYDPTHEFRHSFVQYSAGGLFRWVACGHQSLKDFKRAGGRFQNNGRRRWEDGVKVFSQWSELFPDSV